MFSEFNVPDKESYTKEVGNGIYLNFELPVAVGLDFNDPESEAYQSIKTDMANQVILICVFFLLGIAKMYITDKSTNNFERVEESDAKILYHLFAASG